ncbi:hypothetical protein PSENEW3_00001180 [Picochlorum sp. SENEW3]|nr:hypothetical protein PSENEW3_00001180 [Picochlorum sp. SENEW3]
MHDLYLRCALHIPFKTIHNIQLYKTFKLETQDIAFREAKCCLTFALVSRSEMNGKNLLLAAAIIGTVRHVRPVRRMRNLISSIHGRHVTTLQVDKLPMDIERVLASDDDDDFDIIMTDFVSIAKKAALVPPKKSCLKKTGAPSRNVSVTFEGQKKAWVPKSLMRKKAEAKQKALEAAKKEAELPSTPAVLKRGKEEAPCSISMDSSGDVPSPFGESITSGQSPPKPVPATKRVQILVRASSIDSAESISPKIDDCAEKTCESPAGGDSSFQPGPADNYVDFSQYVTSEDDTKYAVDKIVEYDFAGQLCGLEDNVENLKDYTLNIV